MINPVIKTFTIKNGEVFPKDSPLEQIMILNGGTLEVKVHEPNNGDGITVCYQANNGYANLFPLNSIYAKEQLKENGNKFKVESNLCNYFIMLKSNSEIEKTITITYKENLL